jgi:agmatine deiminase
MIHKKPLTPLEAGFTFPAEWERQSGTWFSWPRPEGISFPGRYHTILGQLGQIIREVTIRQDAHINVPNENWRIIAMDVLKQSGVDLTCVHFHFIKTNESWCRDHGPAFLVKRKARDRQKADQVRESKALAIVDWGFNAWGGKYPPFDDDDRVPTEIARALKIRTVFHPGIIMEGGAVDFNGSGTILTTTDCLLNKNRNPHLSKSEIENVLKQYYGQTHVCWLTGGIAGDDTDGHVDNLARFIDPRTIVMGIESDSSDRNHRVLQRVRKQLDKITDQDGHAFRVVETPMPKPVIIEGQRCPATYVNFLFVNDALLVPTFGDRETDRSTLAILKENLPNHEIVGIDCSNLIWGLGAIHCLTQQMPA